MLGEIIRVIAASDSGGWNREIQNSPPPTDMPNLKLHMREEKEPTIWVNAIYQVNERKSILRWVRGWDKYCQNFYPQYINPQWGRNATPTSDSPWGEKHLNTMPCTPNFKIYTWETRYPKIIFWKSMGL